MERRILTATSRSAPLSRTRARWTWAIENLDIFISEAARHSVDYKARENKYIVEDLIEGFRTHNQRLLLSIRHNPKLTSTMKFIPLCAEKPKAKRKAKK